MKFIKCSRNSFLINVFLIVSALGIVSCETENSEPQISTPVTYLNTYSKIVISSTYISKPDTLSKSEYYLDKSGRVDKVLSFDYSKSKTQYNSKDSFVYDSNNRIIEMYYKNKLIRNYLWTKDSVIVLLPFDGSKYKIYITDNRIDSLITPSGDYRRFEYTGENLHFVKNKLGYGTEYMDYNNEILNPGYYFKSIEMDGIIGSYRPISKNIFLNQKNPPEHGSDYSIPERTYKYTYELDDKNRVISQKNELSLIYKTHYDYFK